METGRVIHRRYLLQRLIEQGQTCAVYQAFDQVLQRVVVVKVTSREYIPVYRAAIRATAQFAHPNIIGVYDLIVEPDTLYIVQEYVEGDDFGTLLQSQLAPYYVVDLGIQICQALIYAGTPSRKVSHGDLTPSAIIRDRRGQVRINNFALPGNPYYFSAWSHVGANGVAFADPELPQGKMSDGRRADDTRAVGLLMYQLLSSRNPDAREIEPASDGRLRFMRNAPADVCEVIARAVIRQHPQYINTPEALLAALKPLAEALEPVMPTVSAEDVSRTKYATTRSGNLVSQPLGVGRDTASADDYGVGGLGVRQEVPRTSMSGFEPYAVAQATTGESPVSSMSGKLVAARQAAYATLPEPTQPKGINVPLLLLFGFILFALFFGIGLYLSSILIK